MNQLSLLQTFEGKIWEKWHSAPMIKKRKLQSFYFRIMESNFNYWKCVWHELTYNIAFIVQYFTLNGINHVKKGKATNHVKKGKAITP